MGKRKTAKVTVACIALILLIAVVGSAVFEAVGMRILFKNSFRLVDENYDCIYSVYGDKILEKDEYIDRMKNANDRIHHILVPVGFTQGMEGGEYIYRKNLMMIYNIDSGIFAGDSVYDDCNSFLHELKHAEDQDPLLYATSISKDAKNIFVEGAASFWAYQSSTRNFTLDAWSDCETDGSYTMEVGSNNWFYGSYVYQYTLFLTLTDYDTIYRYTQSGGDAKIINSKIKEKYGIDAGYFWELAKTCSAVHVDSYIIDQAEIFLNSCLIQDVERIGNRVEALRMLNLYRFLKINTIPRCYRDGIYSTGDYIDIDTIENALFEKVSEYGLLDELTTDIDEQRFIFDCLLYMPNKDEDMGIKGYEDHCYDIQHLPKSINSLRLTFNADTITLQLTDKEKDTPCAQYVNSDLYETADTEWTIIDPLNSANVTELTFG